jgi:hypothetical protein
VAVNPEQRAKEQRAAFAELCAHHEGQAVMLMTIGRLSHTMIHKSTSKPGWWQATRFNGRAEPVGHTEAETWIELVRGLRCAGLDFTTVMRP